MANKGFSLLIAQGVASARSASTRDGCGRLNLGWAMRTPTALALVNDRDEVQRKPWLGMPVVEALRPTTTILFSERNI